MLLIAWEGVDVVRRAIPRLAAVSGTSSVELESLVAMVRRALDDRSPRIPGQHVVSRVLLRQFCEDVPEGPGLLSTYLLQSRSWKALPPSSVARVSNFVKIDSTETEDLWNLTETDLPSALRAARSSDPFADPRHVKTIRDAIVLHLIRSYELREYHDRRWAENLAVVRNWLSSHDGSEIERRFRDKHRGLLPPSRRYAREEMIDDLLAEPRRLGASGFMFRVTVADYFTEVCQRTSRWGLEILYPERGEFLIGDNPAFTIGHGRGALGFTEGVFLPNASSVVLPLAPHRLAALGPANRLTPLAEPCVAELNAFQVRKARNQVFIRPASSLAEFVHLTRSAAETPPV
jgi:hypothetical protein